MIITIKSKRSGNIYGLRIFKEKYKEEYRIANITKGHICPCIFTTYDEAYKDILKYASEGRITLM